MANDVRFTGYWQDVLNFLLGVACCSAPLPWVLGFQSEQTPAWNAYVFGAIIAVVALAAMFALPRLGGVDQCCTWLHGSLLRRGYWDLATTPRP